MTGKVWIVILGFSLLIFAALDLVAVYFILTGVIGFWHGLGGIWFISLQAWLPFHSLMITTLRTAFAFLDKSAYGRGSVIETHHRVEAPSPPEYFRHG